jgi:hypothetical protein
MLAMECGGLLALRQGGAAVPGQRSSGHEFAQLGRVRVVPPIVRSGRTQLRIGVEAPRAGSGQEKFRVHAVASAYPPIAQTEKTFRLPIDYYQVRLSVNFSSFPHLRPSSRICLAPLSLPRILAHSLEMHLGLGRSSGPHRVTLK